jgi:hypothetical protein
MDERNNGGEVRGRGTNGEQMKWMRKQKRMLGKK